MNSHRKYIRFTAKTPSPPRFGEKIVAKHAIPAGLSSYKGIETTKNTKVHENQRVETRMPFTL